MLQSLSSLAGAWKSFLDAKKAMPRIHGITRALISEGCWNSTDTEGREGRKKRDIFSLAGAVTTFQIKLNFSF